jgi:hypothetical protein
MGHPDRKWSKGSQATPKFRVLRVRGSPTGLIFGGDARLISACEINLSLWASRQLMVLSAKLDFLDA